MDKTEQILEAVIKIIRENDMDCKFDVEDDLRVYADLQSAISEIVEAKCVWKRTDELDDEFWETCNGEWTIIGDIEHYKFCPQCGKHVKAKPLPPLPKEEG